MGDRRCGSTVAGSVRAKWVSEDDVVYGSVRAMWAVCGGKLCWCW